MRLRATRLTAVAHPRTAALTPSLALSLRRLRADYAGPAIRVRRSSDNATMDIGFTAFGDLDTSALLSFCGAGDGFVREWRDQSGFDRRASQTDVNAQPRIVSAGAVELMGGRPTVRFFGTRHMVAPLPQTTTVGAYTVVASIDAAAGAWVGLLSFGSTAAGADWNTPGKMAALTRSGTETRVDAHHASAIGAAVVIPALDALFVSTMTYGPSVFDGYVNGVRGDGRTLSVSLSSTHAVIGGRDGGGLLVGSQLLGRMSEVFVTTGTKLTTAQRQALERGQGAYYGVTVA